jgi:hypothetical protein
MLARWPRSHGEFYRRDEELASSVGRYLAGAVLAGGVAVLVLAAARSRQPDHGLGVNRPDRGPLGGGPALGGKAVWASLRLPG